MTAITTPTADTVLLTAAKLTDTIIHARISAGDKEISNPYETVMDIFGKCLDELTTGLGGHEPAPLGLILKRP